MKTTIKILLTVFFFISNCTFAQPWQFMDGPTRPHEVLDLAVGKNASGQKIYAAEFLDTLKISTNSGTSWSTTSQLILRPITVACNSANPDIAVVAKFHQGNPSTPAIFYTANFGSSWSDVTPTASLDFQPQRIAISFGNPDLAFFGTERTASDGQTTLWRSATGGASWLAVDYFRTDATTNINDILAHPQSGYSNYIFIAGSTYDIIDPPYGGQELMSLTPKTKGVWRSSDGGINWDFKADLIPSAERNVTALTVSINGTNNLLFAAVTISNDVKIYQSNDFGETWVLSANRPVGVKQIRSMKVSPANYQFIVCGTDNGVFMSIDRGGTWLSANANLPVGAQNIHDVEFDLNDANGNTAYIATGSSVYQGVYSGGNWTWTPKTTGYNYLNTTSISAQSGTLYGLSSIWSGIAKYSNGSWAVIKSFKDFLGYSTSVYPTNGSYIFAAGSNVKKGIIYKTADNGATWDEVKKLTTTDTYFASIVTDPKVNSQYVHSGLSGSGISTNNFYRSTNLGTSWSDYLISGVSGVPVNTIAADKSSGTSYSTTIYFGLGSTKGVYKSADGGTTFSFAALNGYDIHSIALNSSTSTLANTIYVSGKDINYYYLWKTTNKFSSTSQLSPPFSGAKCILMHPSYPNLSNYLWIVTADGQSIYKTKDGGTTWNEINTSDFTKPINDLRSDNSSNAMVYAATASGVYKINPAPEAPYGLGVYDYCTGGSGNGPQPLRPAPETCYPKLVWQANKEADLNSNSAYVIYKKVGSGDWSELFTVPSSTLSYIDFNVDSPPTTSYCYKLKAKDAAGNLSDFTNPICWPISKISIRENMGKETPKEFALFQNSPNPFNPTTRIEYTIPENTYVTLKIYDVLGREVATLVDEEQTAGNKSVEFDAGRLPSGIYLYRIQTRDLSKSSGQGYTDVKKMLIVK